MPQPSRRLRRSLIIVAGISILGILAGRPDAALADRITLRGGGVVKGKLIPDKAHPDRYVFIGETGKTALGFTRQQVVQVTPEAGPLDDYIVLREQERPTVEAEYELGLWCEEHKLPDLATVHYEAAVKRDSSFGPAHQKLGHVQMGGRYLNADEVKEAQGLVKYKGRWVLPEEKERKEAQATLAAEGSSWVRRIKGLREAYVQGPDERSREAERRLLAINEAVAVHPVMKVLGEDHLPPVRILAARVLAAIPGEAADAALVSHLLTEQLDEVRAATLAEIARRDQNSTVPLLARGLRSKQAEVVNRAAWALASLNAVATVPKLIPVLITMEYQTVMVPAGGNNGGGGIGASFGSVPQAPLGGYSGVGGRSIPVLTPPAVGAGSVAFGASSIPYGAIGGSGVSINGGGGNQGPVPRLVAVEHQNAEVLAALVKMTGRDFGFDVGSWKRWVATSFQVESAPTRRVPQP